MTKKKPKSQWDKLGRPTVMTKEVISKLEFAFANGCTDLEACLYAGISHTAMYDWIKLNPEFAERKEQLKKSLNLVAKMRLAELLKEKPDDLTRKDYADNIKWYLNHKCDEFKPTSKQEITQTTVQKVYVTKDDIENVQEHIDEMLNE